MRITWKNFLKHPNGITKSYGIITCRWKIEIKRYLLLLDDVNMDFDKFVDSCLVWVNYTCIFSALNSFSILTAMTTHKP